ncbi:Myb-like DNA-binding domain containing protein [Trichomonas vaginalis G3]|uniref:Myb-like DNA-binding domain containing protein n=1 Tax=Trichomonas vaginalis (strain ATCC PRA-98 / G3) TaxID=412133 RepID=A2FGJ8_TRIV3|nr:RNA polymerase II transcription regulator recruiting protein [Trichomonas vaginalis G3]EAX95964.1 Myb-like DNA-binding domain containing protein [Trichomonas vaginalis G3]KAI5540463.1 RNA polymerase II transcription regulator recruiting protein [Trichomonas vaginalis G3]|eukprot:XP_001308894.1 Myb-like DNA-binding domain containing protein [Trichomonas vaginalis G3]
MEEIGENHSQRSIIDRYKAFLTQKRSEWTREEDKALMEACRNFKGRWSLIAKFFDDRSGDQVKIRYHQLSQDQIKKKRQQRAEQKNKNKTAVTKKKETTIDENEIWDIINKDFENHFNDIFD